MMSGRARSAAKPPAYWARAKRELTRSDAVLGGIISSYPKVCLQSRGDAFQTLARSIVGQQISVKAAQSVWDRLCGAARAMTPESLLALERAALRACGLEPEMGEIAGSCCPGRYDIAIGGKKIVGIAQRRRQSSKDGRLLAAILVHAMVWLDGDLPEGIDALETFLRDAGASEAFARARMGTLQEIAGVEPAAFEEALLEAPRPALL